MPGCTGDRITYNIDVDSIARGNQTNKYVLLSGDNKLNSGDLQFQEYASYITRALLKRGFTQAESIDSAEVAIFLAYGIGEPQEHQYSYSRPIFGQTGVSSSYTTGSATTYGGLTNYSGITSYTPTYGITGIANHTDTYVTYYRYLILDAINADEFRTSNKLNQEWKTTITSTGSSSDLRKIFPLMVAASVPYIGINTTGKVSKELNGNEDIFHEIMGVSVKDK